MKFLPRYLLLTGMCLMCLNAAAAAAAESAVRPVLGTLLYSATERQALVRQRGGVPDEAEIGVQSLHVSGVVRRDRGKSSAWVNQQVLAEGQSPISVKRTAITARGVSFDGQPVRVGDTLELPVRRTRSDVPPEAMSVRSAP